MKELLLSDWAIGLYGMLFWYVLNIFFPGLNPIVKKIVQSIDKSPMDNDLILVTAEQEAKIAAKSWLEKITASGIFKKLAARYLKIKLP